MYADALRELRRAKQLLPANTVIDSDLGHVYAMAGKHAEARGILAGLERGAGQSYVSSFELALVYLGLGERDKAFERLEQAYRERSDMLVYLRVDPRLDAVRQMHPSKSLSAG